MSGNEDLPAHASEDEERAFVGSREGREAGLAAVHRLERAVALAGPGRERDWLDEVRADLRVVEGTVLAERNDYRRPDSLLSMIARDYPRRFSSRIRQLHEHHEDIVTSIAGLRADMESMGDEIGVEDMRRRVGGLLSAIRDRWARETDLVYEAIRLDLGRARGEG